MNAGAFKPGNTVRNTGRTHFGPDNPVGVASRFKAGVACPRVTVTCKKCGRTQEKGSHRKNEYCSRCVQKKCDEAADSRWRRHCQEARRYRMIMHILGFENHEFDEAYELMRKSPMAFREKAESHDAKVDATWHRKMADAERQRLLKAYAEGVEMPDLIERFGSDGGNINKIAERAGVKRPADFDGRYKRGAA